MAARVADPGQRVHLGEQCCAQRRAGAAASGQERGRHPGDPALDRESELGEVGAVALAGGALLERELRVLGHPVRERERGSRAGLDRLEDPALLGIRRRDLPLRHPVLPSVPPRRHWNRGGVRGLPRLTVGF